MDYEKDISPVLARQAHEGTSHDPERRGVSEIREYVSTLEADEKNMRAQAERGKTTDLFEAEFSRYREGYAKRYRAYLASRSRIVSWLVAGPANFPVRRMQQRNDVASRRLSDLIDFRKRALNAMVKKFRPDCRPIMSGDDNAVERLRAEIASAERRREQWKRENVVCRKTAGLPYEERIAALVAAGCSEDGAHRVLSPRNWWGDGHATFSFTNLSANIRRMKKRLEHVEKCKASPFKSVEKNGIRIEDDPPANRYRLFFPGKPSAEVREVLKRHGFRWAPSQGCWQAYRTDNAFAGMQKVVTSCAEKN